eukprot:194537-Rhodomonas_salina.1
MRPSCPHSYTPRKPNRRTRCAAQLFLKSGRVHLTSGHHTGAKRAQADDSQGPTLRAILLCAALCETEEWGAAAVQGRLQLHTNTLQDAGYDPCQRASGAE